jgi:hypothetical protein
LTNFADLPRLEIVPVENLVMHEHHDAQRTPPLVENLRGSGILRNPPVVTILNRQENRFMVLDGANRVSAFRIMHIPHIVVQVFESDDPNMELSAWNHVVWGISKDDLFCAIHAIAGVRLQPTTADLSFQELMDLHSLVSLHLPNGKVFTAFTETLDLVGRVKALNKVVASYIELAKIDRISMFRIQPLCELYDDLSGLVMLPTFEVAEVIDVVQAGCLMPPGSTRFTFAPRVLHLNYPLSELKVDLPIEEKNARLRDKLCACLAKKCVRYYEEPTYLFDE